MKSISKDKTHKLPSDLKELLKENPRLLDLWKKITPLAKNEWICWIISVKKESTRSSHLKRLCEDLPKGKKRPCCFAGCPHRK